MTATMDNLATRFVEIDRKLTEFNCNYATYLKRKQAMLDTEDKHNALFDKRLSQEEAWIREGIKRAVRAMKGECAPLKLALSLQNGANDRVKRVSLSNR